MLALTPNISADTPLRVPIETMCAYAPSYKETNTPNFILNERALKLIDTCRSLQDDWDGDGAKAPSQKVIFQAEYLVKQLQKIGQKVYHVAPGPDGELMVDLRNRSKSIEIVFYPNRTVYVQFPEVGPPLQGVFSENLLPQILKWLNE